MKRISLISLAFVLLISACGGTKTWEILKSYFSELNTYDSQLVLDSDGYAHVAYISRDDKKIYTKKFNGTEWDNDGTISDTALDLGLAIGPDNSLYICYSKQSDSTLVVQKNNGSTWLTLGSTSSYTVSGQCAIAVDSNSSVYVAFGDTGKNAKFLRYSSKSWENLSSFGGAGEPFDLFLMIDSNNVVYITFGDTVDSIFVKKFASNTWSTLGTKNNFNEDSWASYPMLITDSNNNLIISYSYLDSAYNHKTIVKKYNGSSWSAIGPEVFGLEPAIVCDNDDNIYLAMQDSTKTHTLVVRKYDGSEWTTLSGEDTVSSKGVVSDIVAATNKEDSVYLMFTDGGDSGKAVVYSYK